MAFTVASPLLADPYDACFDKSELFHLLAKGHWKGDFSATIIPPRVGAAVLTMRYYGNLEFVVSNDTVQVVEGLLAPPRQERCAQLARSGSHPEQCTTEYAEKAAKSVHVVEVDGDPVVSGTATSNFRAELNAGSVSAHEQSDVTVHLTAKEDRVGSRLIALLLMGDLPENYQFGFSAKTPYTDTQGKASFDGNLASNDTTTHVHPDLTDTVVQGEDKLELRPPTKPATAPPWYTLEIFTQDCGFASGPVRTFLKLPVKESQWKAMNDERDEALEDEVANFYAAPIPQRITLEYLNSTRAAYQRFRGSGSDYRECVSRRARQKLVQIYTAYQIQQLKSYYAQKVAAATDGKAVCRAGIDLESGLRQLELLGMPDDCPLDRDSRDAMLRAGEAFHKRTGKWPGC